MQMDYINTSHPNFIGGSRAIEIAQQQLKSSRSAESVPRSMVYFCLLLILYTFLIKHDPNCFGAVHY